MSKKSIKKKVRILKEGEIIYCWRTPPDRGIPVITCGYFGGIVEHGIKIAGFPYPFRYYSHKNPLLAQKKAFEPEREMI